MNEPCDRKSKSEISFQPLSEGLGFHPFSDGLPYAPLTPSTPRAGSVNARSGSVETTSMGTGAVAAGPPTVVLPPRVMSSLKKPLTLTPKVGIQVDLRPYDFAYLCRRMGAYMLDLLLVSGLLVGSLVLLVWKQNIEQSVFSNRSFLLAFLAFVLFSQWVLVGAQEVLFKSSLGKAFFGLSFESSSGRIFFRSILFLLSVACLGVGLVWSLFDSRRRCWHDRISRLQPLRGE